MKSKIYDTRIKTDVLSMVALYTTYALKSGMRLEYILRALFIGKPQVNGKVLEFASFDINRMGASTKKMILTGVPKIEPFFMANIRRIKAALVIIFVTQLQNIRQKH